MIRNLTWHRTDFQSTFSEAYSENQKDRNKNQNFKSKKRSDFQTNTQNSDHDSASNSVLWSRTMMMWIKEQSTRAATAHQSASINYYKNLHG